MSFRNLSPQEMFFRTAIEHVPQYRFAGDSAEDFELWKREALPAVLSTLGDFPERVPPDPRMMAEWEQDGLLRQRWLIDVQKHLAAICLVNIPRGLKGEKRPAILCCHGHGPYGKEPVM
ncbi:unnamed protein product, partial [marine sediment metagenome]